MGGRVRGESSAADTIHAALQRLAAIERRKPWGIAGAKARQAWADG